MIGIIYSTIILITDKIQRFLFVAFVAFYFYFSSIVVVPLLCNFCKIILEHVLILRRKRLTLMIQTDPFTDFPFSRFKQLFIDLRNVNKNRISNRNILSYCRCFLLYFCFRRSIKTVSEYFQITIDPSTLTMVNQRAKKGESGSSKKPITNEIVTREYTVNLHKRLHGV